MESTDQQLLTESITNEVNGNLVYIIHAVGENIMHSVGVLEEQRDFFKLTPPTIERLESLEKSNKAWVIENAVVLQFANEYIQRSTIKVLKDLETNDEVLKKYVEKESEKLIEG